MRILIASCLLAQSLAFGQSFEEHCNNTSNLPPAQREFIRVVLEKNYTDCAKLQEKVSKSGWLDLRGGHLTDITLITSIKGIKQLEIDDNNLDDIQALSGLADLEELDVSENLLTKIDALAGLKKLRHLDLGRNRITDLAPLKHLVELRTLRMAGNAISDYSPLKSLVHLTTLAVGTDYWRDDVRCAEKKELTSARNTSRAESLYNVVPALKNLKKFRSAGLNFLSTEHFEKLSQLHSLAIVCASIETTKVLATLPKLKNLNLSNNRLSDIEAPAGPMAFESLDLDGNYLQNAAILASFSDIEEIDLSRNSLSGEFVLNSYPSLRRLELAGNSLKYLDLQGDFPKLGYIDVKNNLLKYIYFANRHNKLWGFSAQNNQLTDPSAGMNLSGVTYLDLAQNNIRDFSFVNAIKLSERNRDFRVKLGGNPSHDFRAITHPELQGFEARGSHLTNLAHLPNTDSIRDLDLGENSLTDVKALSTKYPYLQDLILDGNPLTDGEQFTGFKRLGRLDLSRTKIRSFEFLAQIKQLGNLHLSGNRITNLDFLVPLYKLYAIDLSHNNISDLSVFAKGAFRRISSLNLNANLVADASPLKGLKDLWGFSPMKLKDNPLGTTVAKTPENCPTHSINRYLSRWCRFGD